MPLPGGLAGKYGIRYEDRWTALCAMRVLAEEASAIELDRAGVGEHGFEFSLETTTATEYHQVKRQRTGVGRWDLNALADAGVLAAFYRALQEPRGKCVFASGHAADVLEELGDRARQAETWQELDSERFLGQRTWRTYFDELKAIWSDASSEWAWDALRRIEVVTINEDQLRDMVRLQAELLLDGDLAGAAAVLVETLRDRAGHRLTAKGLWSELEERGYKPSAWSSPNQVVPKLDASNQRYIRSRQETLIGGVLIERPEADELADALTMHRTVLVEGTAGTGKSDVLLQFCLALEQRAVPYLAFRLDRLEETLDPGELGRELGLDGSPVASLAAAAAGACSYLIIDQLDAISTTSGRNLALFDCIDEVLRLAEAQHDMKVVLACRSFDAAHDARLRRLARGKSGKRPVVKVGPLSEQMVADALSRAGGDLAMVRPKLRALLNVPLHLALFVDLTGSREPVGEAESLRDLYGAFWNEKRHQVRDALGREPAWTQVLDRLVDYMSDRQTLHAPRQLVDEWESDVAAMLSSSTLVADGHRLAFFHETFFDYVFARRHSGRQRTVQWLLAQDQFLFRRAQVRQILAHGREGDPEAYLADLRYLIEDPDVRFHLKDLVVSWLGDVAYPLPGERDVLVGLLDDASHPLHEKAWVAVRSPAWFRVLDAANRIEGWLGKHAPERGRALDILTAAQSAEPDRVAELLGPMEEATEDSRAAIASVVSRGDVGSSRSLFELVLELVDDGNDFGNRFLWHVTHDLVESQPAWCCELLGAYVDERLTVATEAGVANPFAHATRLIPRGLFLGEIVVKAAKHAPVAYFEHVWPQMVRAMEQAGGETGFGGPDRNEIWHQPHFSDHGDDLEDDLLAGAEAATVALAVEQRNTFKQLVEQHRSTTQETVLYVLYRGFSAASEKLADLAVEFVLEDSERRFEVGYSSDDHWATRELLAAVSPFCSEDNFAALEQRVLDYYTTWERSRSGIKSLGAAQFVLLSGLDRERLSAPARRRLAELQRKFKVTELSKPVGVSGGVVGSPISEEATRKMKDEHWRKAIAKYHDDRHYGGDWLTGGAHQLSNQLEQRAAEDPVRFAELACSLPDETNEAYFDAVLRGVGKSDQQAPLFVVEALIERIHALPGRPCGRWVAHPLRRHTGSRLSDRLVEILSWYAVEDPDPSPKTPEGGADDDDSDAPQDRLLNRGLNSVRGGMAYTFTRLVHGNAGNIAPLEPAIRSLVRDPAQEVQAMAVETTIGLLRHAPELATELFLELIEDSADAVLATPHVREFLRYRGSAEYLRLLPVIRKMLESPTAELRTTGAVQACLAALSESDAEELAQECLTGDAELRLGAARVYAANVLNPKHRPKCEAVLHRLWEDSTEEVRKAAAEAVGGLRGDDLFEVVPVVEAFIHTRAFRDDPEQALHAIQFANRPPPELALAVCEKVMAALPDSPSIADHAGAVAYGVSKALVQAYADATSAELKNRALDLIDMALRRNILGAYDALREHDR